MITNKWQDQFYKKMKNPFESLKPTRWKDGLLELQTPTQTLNTTEQTSKPEKRNSTQMSLQQDNNKLKPRKYTNFRGGITSLFEKDKL